MQTVIAIALGGACGAVMRHYANNAVILSTGDSFPFGIMGVNIIGSFLMGALVSFFAFIYEPQETLKLFLTVGFLGAFTTFSTYSLDIILLINRGEFYSALLYALLSVVLSVIALTAGMALVKIIAS